MRASYVLPEAGDSGKLGFNDLSPIERLAYEAGHADAQAQRWRIDAEISERRGEPSDIARGYQAQYEREAAERWRQLAEAKEVRHG
jgi:hypothetical protein